MAWFAPKLQPGERVVLRDTALRDPRTAGMVGIAGTGVLLSFVSMAPMPPDMAGALRLLLIVAVPAGVYWLAIVSVSRAVKDGWAITDRRIVTWRGVLRKKFAEMHREEIVETTLDGDDLLVHGGGRTMRLDLKRVRDDALQEALGDSAPPPGRKLTPLNSILPADEKVVVRHPRNWTWIYTVGGALGTALTLFTWMMLWLALEDGSPMRLGLLVVPVYAALILAVTVYKSREVTWSVVLTGRRVLLRRLHDLTRYDAIPLDAIEEIEAPHEGSHRVYLHANGQRYEFRPGSLKVAERMHAAIERAKGAA